MVTILTNIANWKRSSNGLATASTKKQHDSEVKPLLSEGSVGEQRVHSLQIWWNILKPMLFSTGNSNWPFIQRTFLTT